MLSYRGYGHSTGQASEVGIRIDAQTALDYIKSHSILKDTIIIVYGQSLGGAVAIDVASRNSKSVKGLILENTFQSIPTLIPHVLPLIRPFAFLCRECGSYLFFFSLSAILVSSIQLTNLLSLGFSFLFFCFVGA